MIATHMVSASSSGAGQPPSRGRSNRAKSMLKRPSRRLPLSGLLLIDKPQGVTSFDVVAAVRGTLHMKKVGHAGTLDPMATGALIVGFGDATRLLPYIVEHDKTYEATIRLGRSTTTDDADGELIDMPLTEYGDAWRVLAARLDSRGGSAIDMGSVTREWRKLITSTIAERLTGRIEQVPNTFSAIKINGRRAYDLARAGGDVELKARPVIIHAFSVLDMRIGFVDRGRTNGPLLDYEVAGCVADAGRADASSAGRGSAAVDPDGAGFDEVSIDEVNIDEVNIGGVGSGVSAESLERADFVPAIDVHVRVTCSAGTYIRALARDLGMMLGCGGYLTMLRRTRVGRFALPDYQDAANGVDGTSDSGCWMLETAAERDDTGVTGDASMIDMPVVHAHVEPKTFMNRDGETVTRLKCVLDAPSAAGVAGNIALRDTSVMADDGGVGDSGASHAGGSVGYSGGNADGNPKGNPDGNHDGEAGNGSARDLSLDRAGWLRSQALHMADAARGAMPCLGVTIDEARLLRFGQRVERSGLRKGMAYAAIAPLVCDASNSGDDGDDGDELDLVAIVERANAHQIKPVTVFAAAQ